MSVNPITAVDIALSNDRDVDTAREVLLVAAQKALFDKVRATIETGVWDGQSDVWDLSAATLQTSYGHEIPAGGVAVYLREITADGSGTRMFQPFKPGVSGFQPILPADAEEFVSDMADEVAQDRTNSAIYAAMPQNFFKPFDPMNP